MNICIECIWDSDFQKVADITVPVIEAYAARHGYCSETPQMDSDPAKMYHRNTCLPMLRNIQWHRVKVIGSLLEDFPIVCHIDADVLITNPEIRLEDLMPAGDWDIAMSRETGGALNDGTCLFRNTAATRAFLQLAWDSEAPDATSMNGVIQKMFDDGTLSQHINLAEIPKRKFNSYWDDWRPGDFALHLPGMSNERRVMIFTKVQKELPAMEMRELLRPWKLNAGDELARLGRKLDGGYLVPESVLDICNVLYSYGVGEDYSFEQDFAKNVGEVHMYDHTVDVNPTEDDICFYKIKCEPIVIEKITDSPIYRSILKLDIEGDEYTCLWFCDRWKEKPLCLVVEFHWIFQSNAPDDMSNAQKLKTVLGGLESIGYRIVHVHGNNHGRYINGLPETVEVTFVQKHIVSDEQFVGVLPLPGLDFPNDPNKPDYAIHFE
jgi:hypothetical protein